VASATEGLEVPPVSRRGTAISLGSRVFDGISAALQPWRARILQVLSANRAAFQNLLGRPPLLAPLRRG